MSKLALEKNAEYISNCFNTFTLFLLTTFNIHVIAFMSLCIMIVGYGVSMGWFDNDR